MPFLSPAFPGLLVGQILVEGLTLWVCLSFPSAENKGKRNPLHDYRKTVDTSLVRIDKALKVKTKLLNTTEQCAKRCSRSKGLLFICRAFAFDKTAKRCHWLSFTSLENGVRKKQDNAFILYEKKDYVRNCIIGKGATYKGNISVTKSGIECQAWNSTIPHEHSQEGDPLMAAIFFPFWVPLWVC
uniref:Hepatocyte growth factor n=1 Tax=Naja naja TaxID=35670 RepID=A0A8C6Y255_NAJNA